MTLTPKERWDRWNAAHPKARSRAALTNHEDLLVHATRTLFVNAKNRAAANGTEFDIGPDDVVIPAICPVLGGTIMLKPLRHHFGPSLDRVDSSKGYVKGNVRVISWRANRLKSDATLDELRALVRYMEA